MAKAWFVVRAVVANETERSAFDRWYEDDRLPGAVRLLHARSAWRGWSTHDPSVHTAFYLFDSPGEAHAAANGETVKGLVAALERQWGHCVTLTRDIIEVASEMEPTA